MSDQGAGSPGQEARPDDDRNNRAIVARVLQELHDQGVVDMNAPAREAVPYLQQSIARAQQGSETTEMMRAWWIFVGSCGGDAYMFACVSFDF